MRTVTGSAKLIMKGVLVAASALSPMPAQAMPEQAMPAQAMAAQAMAASGEIRLVNVAAEGRFPTPAVTIGVDEAVATGTWTWRADADGHLVTISGRQLVGAKELVLEDSTTGQVVWHETAQYSVPGVEGQQAQSVYLGVKVQSGRSYRLRVVYAGSAPEQTQGSDTPRFVVFPRSAASGAR